MSEKKFFDALTNGHCPRLWLIMQDRHLLLQWALISNITASQDFLELEFDCEYGHIQLSHSESLQNLYEEMQLERVRHIDARQLNCRLVELKDKE